MRYQQIPVIVDAWQWNGGDISQTFEADGIQDYPLMTKRKWGHGEVLVLKIDMFTEKTCKIGDYILRSETGLWTVSSKIIFEQMFKIV